MLVLYLNILCLVVGCFVSVFMEYFVFYPGGTGQNYGTSGHGMHMIRALRISTSELSYGQ